MKSEGITVHVKRIYQKDLTSDCWPIQVWGLSNCRKCEYLATEDCGGQRIRKKILAGKYPLHGLPNVG